MYELAVGLIERGHTVTVLTSVPKYNLTQGTRLPSILFFSKRLEEGVTVLRVNTLPIHNVGPFVKGIGQIALPWFFLLGSLAADRPDVIAVYSPPLTLGISSYVLGWLKRAPYLFNVQDLFPQNAMDLGVLRNRFLIRAFEAIEAFSYRHARFITVHSEGNQAYLLNKGMPSDRVRVIHNWADTTSHHPDRNGRRFREEYHLDGQFTLLFAGVMGYAQDLETVIECAYLLRDHHDILFLLVGDGVEKPVLVRKAEDLGLTNVRFADFVGKDDTGCALKDPGVYGLRTAIHRQPEP
jgi:glycosyltransferase involved in cell wall biosynthesis